MCLIGLSQFDMEHHVHDGPPIGGRYGNLRLRLANSTNEAAICCSYVASEPSWGQHAP